MNVIVIGGGIVGLSSAYYLNERQADVTLFEKGALGMESTARSAGGIRSQFSTPVNVKLSLASKRVWNCFEDEFGIDIEYRKAGYIFLARNEDGAKAFRKNVRMQNDLGADSEYLGAEEATRHCPGLLPEKFVGATFNGDDGVADPNLAVQGYANAARAEGVDIRTKTTVTDVLCKGRRVVGVKTEKGGRHTADYVVNAAGAYAAGVANMAGVDLSIDPRRRQVAVVDPTRPVPEDIPLTIDLESGSYFRPERDGDAIVGGYFDNEDPSVNPATYSTAMDIDWAARAVERAADYAQYFDPDTRIKRGWAGLYAVTPDSHPIIEETRPGFVTASGFSGHGFQHAPAAGQLVTELVFEGESKLVDVSALTNERFEQGNEVVEHNVA
jgi:sarcosine oxidase subunit beta